MRNSLVCNSHKQLVHTDEGVRGLDYLKSRGVNSESIETWNLGYCPEAVESYQFRDRIIVPYYNQYNEIVAVSCRKIENEKPVWWNEKFSKKNHLFGLDKAKEHIFKNNLAIVVEGQFDVVAFHQRGLKMVVGVCGSTFDEKQLTLLSRYCNRIMIAFDVDKNKAGQQAASKAFDMLKGMNIYMYRWFFPQDIDPDLYIRTHGEDKCRETIKDILEKYSYKERDGFKRKFYFGEGK
jgi:DNA primase